MKNLIFIGALLMIVVFTIFSIGAENGVSYLKVDVCYLREAEQKEIYGEVVMPIESLCYEIKGTPAWVKDGKIIDYGYKDWNTIPRDYFFYYNPACPPCIKQIKDFGEEYFTELKQRGYAIDCTK